MTLRYGRCDGGPYHARPLAHHEDTMALAYERHAPMKAHPAMVATSDPVIAFGGYVFDHGTQIWNWKAETLWQVRPK